MVFSSCLANFGAFCLLMTAAILGYILAVRVQEILKDREMTTFPFKKLLVIFTLSSLFLCSGLLSFSLMGTGDKTINLAFNKLEIEKCQSLVVSEEEDGEGDEDIALNCQGDLNEHFKFSRKHF